jgi:MFS family permease
MLLAAENTSNLVTPAIGGALFAYLGPLPALTINALTYLGSQLSLVSIPSLGPERTTGLPTLRHLLSDIALGYRALWADLGMRAQAFVAFSINIFGFGCYAILIPFLKKGFDATDQQVGFFFAISAVGAIGGASVAAHYADRWPLGRSLTLAYLLDALFFIPVVLVSNIWLAAFFWASSNALANFEIAQIIGFRMRVTPEHMVGRLMGAVRLLVLAGIAPSVMFFGWVADHRSPHVAMAIACIGAAVVAVGALFTPAIRNESR